MEIALDNIRQAEGILDNLAEIKEVIENKINLENPAAGEKRTILTGNKIMRICLLVGLYQSDKRDMKDAEAIQLSKSSIRIPSSFFTHMNLRSLFSALLKLRYSEYTIDWKDSPTISRIIACEMYRGRDYLMKDNNLDNFMFSAGFSSPPAMASRLSTLLSARMEMTSRQRLTSAVLRLLIHRSLWLVQLVPARPICSQFLSISSGAYQ